MRQTPKGCQCVVVTVPAVEGLVEIVRVLEVEVVLGPKRHQRVVNGRRSMEGTTITSEGWHCLLVPGLDALSFQTLLREKNCENLCYFYFWCCFPFSWQSYQPPIRNFGSQKSQRTPHQLHDFLNSFLCRYKFRSELVLYTLFPNSIYYIRMHWRHVTISELRVYLTCLSPDMRPHQSDKT